MQESIYITTCLDTKQSTKTLENKKQTRKHFIKGIRNVCLNSSLLRIASSF